MGKIRVSRRTLAVWLAAVFAALVGFVGVGASAATAVPEAGTARQAVTAGSTKGVAVNGLRLRSKAGYNGYIKGLLYRGDRVFIREVFASDYNPNWVGVVLTQRSKSGLPRQTFGYVYKAYLK